MYWPRKSTAAPPTEQHLRLTWPSAPVDTWVALKDRYAAERAALSDKESAHLSFLRWLHERGVFTRTRAYAFDCDGWCESRECPHIESPGTGVARRRLTLRKIRE